MVIDLILFMSMVLPRFVREVRSMIICLWLNGWHTCRVFVKGRISLYWVLVTQQKLEREKLLPILDRELQAVLVGPPILKRYY